VFSDSAPTYRQRMADAGTARVHACVMTLGSWSVSPFTGIDANHKPEPPRLRVTPT